VGVYAAAYEVETETETETPRRIISLSPNVTEILDGIGVFDRVVAVSRFCEYPEAVDSLPRVGGWTNTSLEQVIGLDPDLVILTNAQAPLIENRLRRLDISTLVVGSQSLADIYEAIDTIGIAVGRKQAANQLADDMRNGLAEIESRTSGREKPVVLTVVDRLPGTLRDLYIATEGSYLTELVRIAGGEPITPPAPHNYAQIGTEALVAFNPEVVFDMVQALATPVLVGTSELAENPEAVWRTISIRAVREDRVYPLLDKRLVHPSQFALHTARVMARLLHPSAFPEAEAEAEAKEPR
jgi:iron complex transport system substrate-binding protein